MTHTKIDLVNKIVELSTAHWDKTSEPLLLSQLGPELKGAGYDHKEILHGEGLRHFIDKEIDDLTIAKHPQQRAKIGVHPASKEFSFPDALTKSAPELTALDKQRKNRQAFYGFVRAISDFPPEEIDDVHIPTRVIVRLLEGK